MKKLLILTAVAVLAASSVGCCGRRARNAWYRGAVCTPPVASVGNCCGPTTCCDSGCASGNCASSGGYTGSYMGGYINGGSAGCSSCESGGSVTTIPVDPAPSQGMVIPDRTGRPVPEPNDT